VTLRLATAGESHGPALVGILSGLPAGLKLDRTAIDADLRRRQQGHGRSPRQKLERDQVEVLAGLRHGRTLGTPLGFLVHNLDHENWAWGMSPWPPEGDATGKGTQPVTLPRPGHADLAGALKFGLADVRDALERASARQTAVTVAAGAIAKRLLEEIGITVESAVLELGGARDDIAIGEAVDAARADRDTLGGVVEVRAHGVPPGLGSYATAEERLDARLGGALMGTQAVKAVEIGAGRALARIRGSEAHDEILRAEGGRYFRPTNRAGGIEGGVSNGEPVVVRAAMKPLPTLMRPLRSVDLATGEPGEALVERSDVAAVEALAVVTEAVVALELARAAREKFGGDSTDDFVAAYQAYVERIPWTAL
jgi:chorismate synthase